MFGSIWLEFGNLIFGEMVNQFFELMIDDLGIEMDGDVGSPDGFHDIPRAT